MDDTDNRTPVFLRQSTGFSFPELNCQSGETLLITGKSGCGKTTLLHLLAGIRKPIDGKIFYNGIDLYHMGDSHLDLFRGQNIGIVFQRPFFINAISVYENLTMTQALGKKQPNVNLANELLEWLGISHLKNKLPARISIGEQQRLGIARALINQPKVLLADEPTSALDDVNTKLVIELLKEAATRTNCATIIVTHDQRLKSFYPKSIAL